MAPTAGAIEQTRMAVAAFEPRGSIIGRQAILDAFQTTICGAAFVNP
jgi:hypothetical protein